MTNGKVHNEKFKETKKRVAKGKKSRQRAF